MDPAALKALVPDVVGTVLIGLFLNTFLYGIVFYQFIVYFNAGFKDPLWMRGMVWGLAFMDTLHSAIAIYAAWEMCVANFGDYSSFFVVSWTIPFTASATALVAMVSQIFLAHRVLLFSKNTILAGFIVLLSVVSCFFGFYAGVQSGIVREVAKFSIIEPYVICWLVFQTAADFIITASLSYSLIKSRTGFRRTDTIIFRLVRGCVQTGLFVTIFAMGDLFSFLFLRTTNLYAMFAYPIGRIYTNTLLDTLNARAALKNVPHTVDIESEINHGSNAIRLQSQQQSKLTFATGGIRVEKDTVTDHHHQVSEFDRDAFSTGKH